MENIVFKSHHQLIMIFYVCLSVLFFGQSVIGITLSDQIYPTKELMDSFVTNDIINLVIGIPLIIASLYFALHDKKIGFPGLIAFILLVNYTAISYGIAIHSIYAIVMSSITFILGFATFAITVNYGTLEELQYSKPFKHPLIHSIILIAFGFLFIIRAIISFFDASLSDSALGVCVADIVISLYWLFAAYRTITKETCGASYSVASYLHGGIMFVGLIFYMLIQPLLTDNPFVLTDFVVILFMSLILIIPMILQIKSFYRSL